MDSVLLFFSISDDDDDDDATVTSVFDEDNFCDETLPLPGIREDQNEGICDSSNCIEMG